MLGTLYLDKAQSTKNKGQKKMLALRVDKKRLAVKNVSKPDHVDEAVVRVLLSGICNTDLEIARGYAGFNGPIGHEFVGVVEDSTDRALVGRPDLLAQLIESTQTGIERRFRGHDRGAQLLDASMSPLEIV